MGNSRKLICLDVDGTLTKEISIWEYLLKRTEKWYPHGKTILNRFLDGNIGYDEFCRLETELLRGFNYYELKKYVSTVSLYDGIGSLFKHLEENNYIICLLSAGLKIMTDIFTEQYQIDHCVVNELEFVGDICTGKEIVNIGWKGKGKALQRILNTVEDDVSFIISVGDSDNDVPVFELSDRSILTNPKDAELKAYATYTYYGNDLGDIIGLL